MVSEISLRHKWNAAALVFKTPGACFEIGSSVKWSNNAASMVLHNLQKRLTALLVYLLMITLLTTGGKMAVQVRFTFMFHRCPTLWRVEVGRMVWFKVAVFAVAVKHLNIKV